MKKLTLFAMAICPLIGLGIVFARLVCNFFNNKKTLRTGPIGSGKTTLLKHLSKEPIKQIFNDSRVPKARVFYRTI